MARYTMGIDAGGTKVAYGLFDAAGKLLRRFEHPTDAQADGPAFTDQLVDTAYHMLEAERIGPEDLEGIGVCMPSFILYDQGYIYLTSAMTNIRDFPMRDYISARLPTRVVLDNDGNVAALAEHRHGAGKGSRHMVYIAASTGIGSGIIIDGKLFHGSYGWAGECGHMLATPEAGLECGCRNRGCVMSYASGRYIAQHAKARLAAGADSILGETEELSARDILNAYHKGDPLAKELVGQMAQYMAVCIFNIYQLLNINLFVFGGGLVNFGDVLFGPMREIFDRYNHIPQPVDFRFAALEQDFGIIGAAELVKE
mgnify:CR=1 FL=1